MKALHFRIKYHFQKSFLTWRKAPRRQSKMEVKAQEEDLLIRTAFLLCAPQEREHNLSLPGAFECFSFSFLHCLLRDVLSGIRLLFFLPYLGNLQRSETFAALIGIFHKKEIRNLIYSGLFLYASKGILLDTKWSYLFTLAINCSSHLVG